MVAGFHLQPPAVVIDDAEVAVEVGRALSAEVKRRHQVDPTDRVAMLLAEVTRACGMVARSRVVVDGVDEAVDEQRQVELATSGWVRPGDAMVRLGVTKQRVSMLVRTEALRGLKVGSAVWIDPQSIEAYRARRKAS